MPKIKLELEKAIKNLEISTKNLVTTTHMGHYKSFFRGKGVEFDSYRDYDVMDDSDLIDWKASLRGGKTLVKQFVEERNLDIFFLLDVSSSMVYTTTSKLKNIYAAELVASLAYVTIKAGDNVGMAMFNDRMVKTIQTSKKTNQFYVILKTLADTSFYGGNYDLNEALKFAINYVRENSVLVVVSDFIGLKKGWEEHLKIAAKKFDLIGMMIKDPSDIELPSEDHEILLNDPFSTNTAVIVPDEVKDYYKYYVAKKEGHIKKIFSEADADIIKLVTDYPFAPEIIRFFRERARRIKV